ncbi:GNAT family N-acetyltransferase [Nocardioides sp. GY 10127]|uniref:GNAT family N-acetyltransferase n=1 Tax=Nocardioides sp. GY 10127 TaxID=2569762 RepID=UPI0010A78949|nr:GNAT family N-acetyltransferase [Nocardioides sp. GY 10127]TIC84053.1 GNAT family N-acetyltransferase [Nocardioides sp. GY 10127]
MSQHPPDQPAGPARPVRVRPARPSDLRHLAAVEDSGAEPFRALLGAAAPPALLAAAPSGLERDAAPGRLLVAAERDGSDSAVVGFAHVLHVPGEATPDGFARAHLEQVSVLLPTHGRRGIGTALVRAALEDARWDGFERLSLCTYAEIPWNGPFYRRLGFEEVAEPEPWQARIRAHERSLGLDGAGRRVVMERPTR